MSEGEIQIDESQLWQMIDNCKNNLKEFKSQLDVCEKILEEVEVKATQQHESLSAHQVSLHNCILDMMLEFGAVIVDPNMVACASGHHDDLIA